jgi:hypothetical protein
MAAEDYKPQPGRGELPPGLFASRFGGGVQANSCMTCREILAGYASIEAAIKRGFACGMYGQDIQVVGYCHRQARPGRRN